MFANEEVALKELEKWCRQQVEIETAALVEGAAGDYPQYVGRVSRITAFGDVIEETQKMIRRFRNGEND